MTLRKPGQGIKIPYVAVVFLGNAKIGKTRMAGMFPDAHFMDFDEGAGHVDAVGNTYPRNETGFDVALTELIRMARLQPTSEISRMYPYRLFMARRMTSDPWKLSRVLWMP